MQKSKNVATGETRPAPEPLSDADRSHLEQVDGIIFNIQRYSLHDGPGLRTNVFLKGCPLRCHWCANPESQQPALELALAAQDCIQCGQFAEACPVGWGHRAGPGQLEPASFDYEVRVAVCPTGAIHWLGERRTAGEVMQAVRRDVPFYENGGGLTLTGGEPTMQPHLAEADYISTAMETCGYTTWPVLERLLPYLDTVLFDLKHLDRDKHRTFTGVDNQLILANLRCLAALQAPLRIRVPLIPGFNTSLEDLQAIAEFVLSLPGPRPVMDLLPYHTLGQAKYRALGRDDPWAGHDRLAEAEVAALVKVVESYGLPVQVGG